MDEAAVANAVTNHSGTELLRQTDLPLAPMFAISTKLVGSLISPPELGLRLLPILFGIGCVPLTYLVIRTLRVPRVTALVGMALCASSPSLVIWSREVKQYQIEAFFSVLLALLVFRLRRCGVAKRQRILAAGIIAICVFGPWFGYGLVFSAVTLLALLVLLRPVVGCRRIPVVVAITGLCAVAGSVVLMLHLAASGQAGDKALLDFMGQWFIDPTSLRAWARAGAYGASSTVLMILPWPVCVHSKPVATLLGPAIWLVVLLGLWFWPRRGRTEMACWTVVPWLLLLGAAAAGRYPFGAERLMLFLAPALVASAAMGLVAFCRKCSQLMTGRNGFGVLAALIASFVPVLYMVNVPLRHQYWANHDWRTAVEVLWKERMGEPVIVTMDAVQPVRFYCRGRDEEFKYMPVACGTRPKPGCDYRQLAQEMLREAGAKWWLLTMARSGDPTHSAVAEEARKQGYRLGLAAEAGGRQYGKARLYAAVKSTLW